LETKTIIPFFGVDRQYATIREEILDITDKVYSSGKVLDHEYTINFEKAIAQRCNRKFAISVNSGTQALIFALQSIFPAGEVLIPALSFIATLNSVVLTQHTPKFIDIDQSGMMDLSNVNFSLNSEDIAAVMYVNLYGNVIDYDKLKVLTEFWGRAPKIIEDAAQSFGSTYKGIPSGKLGDISVLSFDPTKNLNNYGSGGMLLTDDHEMALVFYDFRDNGKQSGHEFPGSNSKMSESDCAQMLVKLKYFDDWQERRHAIATYYTQQFGQYVDIVGPGPDVIPNWHKFVMLSHRRESLTRHLIDNGITVKLHYSEPLDAYLLASPYNNEICLSAHDFTKQCMSLPIYPELTDNEVERIADSVKEFFS
jgi:dTDP-4-amino-4,6-dideoxygalactose transaminase